MANVVECIRNYWAYEPEPRSWLLQAQVGKRQTFTNYVGPYTHHYVCFVSIFTGPTSLRNLWAYEHYPNVFLLSRARNTLPNAFLKIKKNYFLPLKKKLMNRYNQKRSMGSSPVKRILTCRPVVSSLNLHDTCA